MVKLFHSVVLLSVILGLTMFATAQETVEAPNFQPASEAMIVRLHNPTQRLSLPPPIEIPDSPGRMVRLDPSWLVESAKIAPDGRTAYLVVRRVVGEIDSSHNNHPLKVIKASIRRIDLESGEVLGTYEIPEPFAFASPDPMTGSTVFRLAIPADGRSLIASCRSIHTIAVESRKPDRTPVNGTFFFRWDVQTGELTHQRTLDFVGSCFWQLHGDGERLLVTWFRSKAWSIESWDTRDLTVSVLLKGPEPSLYLEPQSRYPRPVPQCVEIDQETKRLWVAFAWRPASIPGRESFMLQWLRTYDLRTGKPVGPGTKFVDEKTVDMVMLRGKYLLLRESDPDGLWDTDTLHLWNVRTAEHVTAIAVPVKRRMYAVLGVSTVTLSDDGSTLIIGDQRLDLDRFDWHRAWQPREYDPLTAVTSNGQRMIVVKNTPLLKTGGSATLEVYDLK